MISGLSSSASLTPTPNESIASLDPAFADERLEMLRRITRQMATAEDLETVLRSITTSLAQHGDAILARIFLLVTDRECGY